MEALQPNIWSQIKLIEIEKYVLSMVTDNTTTNKDNLIIYRLQSVKYPGARVSLP